MAEPHTTIRPIIRCGGCRKERVANARLRISEDHCVCDIHGYTMAPTYTDYGVLGEPPVIRLHNIAPVIRHVVAVVSIIGATALVFAIGYTYGGNCW